MPTSISFALRRDVRRAGLLALTLATAMALTPPPAFANSDDFAIEAEGYRTASDVRQHNRLPFDLADIRTALNAPEPDFAAALERYAFGGGFRWRDGFHSFGIFADDYQGRITQVLPASVALHGDGSFAHTLIVSAMMGTGEFRGSGQSRSQAPELRRATVEDALLATILNWCRLELSEASIRGPQNGNWSLGNGSPKNWNELFAFWWGPEGEHSLHAEMSVLTDRYGLPEHPTRLLTAQLAEGQELLLTETWPTANAAEVRRILDLAALLLLLDRAHAAEDGSPEAMARLRGIWVAAGDSLARVHMGRARVLNSRIAMGDPGVAGDLKAAVAAALPALGLDPTAFGSAL